MDAKRFMPLVVALLCVGAWVLSQRQTQRVDEPTGSPGGGFTSWDAKAFGKIAADVESNYAAGVAFLQAHDYEKAYEHAVYGGRNIAEAYAVNFPSNVARPGVIVEDWAERLELTYRMACTKELDWCIESLMAGRVTVESVRALIDRHREYPELKEKFESLQPEIDEVRNRAGAEAGARP